MIRRIQACLLLLSLPCFLAIGLAGCAKRHEVNIESNTCWTALFENQGSAAGVANKCGSANYRVAGEIHCVSVRNLSDTGFVRVRIDDGAWVTNSSPKGTAEACR